METYIFNEQQDVQIDPSLFEQIAKEVLDLEGQKADEVTINFVSTEKISELHQQFFNDPSTTDCISFPLDSAEEEYRVLGEIFVCPATALDYSKKHQINVHEEITLYVIHGLLHLMGYDDIEVKDRKMMRLAEKKHLENLYEKKII